MTWEERRWEKGERGDESGTPRGEHVLIDVIMDASINPFVAEVANEHLECVSKVHNNAIAMHGFMMLNIIFFYKCSCCGVSLSTYFHEF